MRATPRLLAVLSVTLGLAACGDPHVDGNDPDSFDHLTTTFEFDPPTVTHEPEIVLEQTTIDFEGIGIGEIVSKVIGGEGISGYDGGTIVTDGGNVDFPGQNAAMIFDGSCGGAADATEAAAQCSGGDADLWWPGADNVLIISEDLDGSDPDDLGGPSEGDMLAFDFTSWGDGSVIFADRVLTAIDVEGEGSVVQLWGENFDGPGLMLLAEIPIEPLGDNEISDVMLTETITGVTRLEVHPRTSIAIDGIRFTTEVVRDPNDDID